jgi:hypothetical protein
MKNWIIVLFVAMLYVHLFNAIAKLYLDSERRLTPADLWRRVFPSIKIQIEL